MPESVIARSRLLLAAYLRGEIRARKCPRYKTHYLCLNIGGAWRYLCLKPEDSHTPEAWHLVHHAQYEKIIAKR